MSILILMSWGKESVTWTPPPLHSIARAISQVNQISSRKEIEEDKLPLLLYIFISTFVKMTKRYTYMYYFVDICVLEEQYSAWWIV